MRISDSDLTVLKDACGLHEDFTSEEVVEIQNVAQRLKLILEASKKRAQERIARAGR